MVARDFLATTLTRSGRRLGDRRAAARAICFGVCLAMSAWTAEVAAAATVLIRPDEASLPPAPAATTLAPATRGIVRRPRVVLVAPETGVSSPFTLKFVFRPIGGSVIETNSVKVLYLKQRTIDLTKRIAPFITNGGIDIVGAEAPPGNHTLRIVVSDSQGRTASAVFMLKVVK